MRIRCACCITHSCRKKRVLGSDQSGRVCIALLGSWHLNLTRVKWWFQALFCRGELNRAKFCGFEIRTLSHGVDALVILDPTSTQTKNVTPHCFKLKEILVFFRNLDLKFEKLRDLVRESGELGEINEAKALGNAGFKFGEGKVGVLGEIFGFVEFNNIRTTLDAN